MANQVEIEILFNDGSVKKGLAKLPAQAKASGKKSGKNFNQGFKESVSTLNVAVGTVIAGQVTRAIGAIKQALSDGVTAFRAFDRAIAEVNTILPANAKITEQATAKLEAFSEQFATSKQQQAKAFYQIVSAGVQGTSNQLAVLEASNAAATAGLVDIQTAADALTTSINSYSKTGLTATQASDALFAAVREGKTTFGELGFNIGRVASIGQTAGVSFGDLTGALAFLTKTGIRTDEATVGLRQAINRIIKGAGDAAPIARKLGIEFSAAGLKARGLGGFLTDLAKRTGGNVEVLQKLFPNVRAFGAVVKIASGDLKDFNRILGETNTAGGDTQNALSEVQKSLDFKLEKASKQFESFFSTITQEFFKVATQGQSLNVVVADLLETFAFFAKGINDFVIAPTEIVFNLLRAGFDNFNAAVGGLVSSIGATIRPVVAAFDALGIKNETIEGLRTFADSSEEIFNELADKAKSSTDRIFEGTVFGKGEEFIEGVRQRAAQARAALEEGFAQGAGTGAGNGGGGDGPEVGLTKVEDDFLGLVFTLRKGEKVVEESTRKIAATVKQNLVRGISGGIQTVVNAIANGQDAFKALTKFVLNAFADLAIQTGAVLIGTGLGIESLKSLQGGAAIAAGAGLVAVGAAIKAFLAKGSGTQTGSAGGASFAGGEVGGFGGPDTLAGQTTLDERAEPEAKVVINVEGSIYDAPETGLRLANLLEQTIRDNNIKVVGAI